MFALLMSYSSLKSPSLRKIFEGTPTVVIERGKILEDNLMKKLREHNAFSVADVEFAIMENDGKLYCVVNCNSWEGLIWSN